jgi:hypothetical protein
MVNSTTYDVLEPWMLMIGDSSAIVVTQTREDMGYRTALDWRTISIAHILEFQDLPAAEKRKRA